MITETTYSQAMTGRTFESSTRDHYWQSNTFHVGHLRHVIAALGETPVVVVIDGMAHVGVRLGAIRQTPGYGTFQVLVTETYIEGDEGKTQSVFHPVHKVEMIIPLTDRREYDRVKWNAIDTIRAEKRAGLDAVRKTWEADGLNYGKWTTELGCYTGEVDVTYEPQRDGAGSRRWERVRLTEGVVV